MVYDLIASAAFGVESTVKRELSWLGVEDAKAENGKINFKGDEAMIMKANLWIRTADRIYINMGKFRAETFEDLFHGVKAMPWENFVGKNGAFPVSGKSVKSILHSVPDCQKITKKAIAERLKSVYGVDWLDEDGPEYKIEVSLLNDEAMLTIDTSGTGLHKRGYRAKAGEAPLKETLACALIYTSRWKKDRVLMDPMCGSGTIAIEAALMAMNMAPGLNRHFAFEKWPQFSKSLWQDILNEARDEIDYDAVTRRYASDIDGKALALAREHAKNAGVDEKISFQKLDLADTSSKYEYGFIITNPTYGERLSDKTEIEKLYKKMGAHFKKFKTWSYYIITSYEQFEKFFGRRADKKRKLYNGMLKCDYYQYFGPKPDFKARKQGDFEKK